MTPSEEAKGVEKMDSLKERKDHFILMGTFSFWCIRHKSLQSFCNAAMIGKCKLAKSSFTEMTSHILKANTTTTMQNCTQSQQKILFWVLFVRKYCKLSKYIQKSDAYCLGYLWIWQTSQLFTQVWYVFSLFSHNFLLSLGTAYYYVVE